MKFLFACGLSIFVVYIVLQGDAIWYLSLVWLVPLTLFVWWTAIPSLPDDFFDKFINK